MEKLWHLANRDAIRQRLADQKENNIKREEKAGIKKNYRQISHPQFFMTTSNSERPIATAPTAVQDQGGTIFSINSKVKSQAISPVEPVNPAVENIDHITADGELTIDDDQRPPTQEQTAASRPAAQTGGAHFSNLSIRRVNSMATTGFRVRQEVIPKQTRIVRNMKMRSNVERLSKPKQEYIPQNPYLYQEFRGLFSADFQEALSQCFDQDTLEKINKLGLEDLTSDKDTLDLIHQIRSSL